MNAQEKSELLRRLVEGVPVFVITTDGRERAVESLECNGREVVGWRTKYTNELIPAETVEAVAF